MGDGTAAVAQLAELVGWSGPGGDPVDWPAVEESVGFGLPSDYKALLAAFPSGRFAGLVRPIRPGTDGYPPTDYLGFHAYVLDDMRGWRRAGHGDFPYPIHPEPGGLLPWARGRRLEPIFWLTGSGDPDSWPVIAVDSDYRQWRTFAGTATEFLIALVSGDFDTSSYGVDAAGPAFVPDQDETAAAASAVREGARVVDRSAFFRSRGTPVDEFPSLATLLGPPPAQPDPVDWAEAEDLIGPLPADYKSFIDTYGPGTYWDVRIAAPGGPGALNLFDLLTRTYEDIRARTGGVNIPLHPEAGGFIAWGGTPDGWTLGWAPTDPDPDRWGVVSADGSRLDVLGLVQHSPDVSFSAFLVEYAQSTDDLGPITGREPLWRNGS